MSKNVDFLIIHAERVFTEKRIIYLLTTELWKKFFILDVLYQYGLEEKESVEFEIIRSNDGKHSELVNLLQFFEKNSKKPPKKQTNKKNQKKKQQLHKDPNNVTGGGTILYDQI